MRWAAASLVVATLVCLCLGTAGLVLLRLSDNRGGEQAVVGAAAERGEGARVGERAPVFSATTLSGERISLAELQGKLVVLNFWASWCGPCRSEMPALEAAAKRTAGQPIVFLGVNVQEPPETVRAFVAELGLTFPILPDPTGEIARTYQVRALPTTFFIDREGRLREQFTGEMNASVIDRRLRSYGE